MILNLQPGDQRRHANNGYARCNQSIPMDGCRSWIIHELARARTINDALREKRPVSFLLDLLT